jgi:hypothetical protein
MEPFMSFANADKALFRGHEVNLTGTLQKKKLDISAVKPAD